MKYIKYTMSILLLAILLSSCRKEDKLVADFESSGPFPEITLGTTEASQIRFDIYEDYNIHIYYDLSGEEAATTPNGRLQTAAFSETYVTRADEDRTVIFLKLIREMFDMFSANMNMLKYRRYVMVSDLGITSSAKSYYGYGYNLDYYPDWSGTYVLGSVNDAKEFDLGLTKECLLYTFFDGSFDYYFSVPDSFIGLSAGNYYDELREIYNNIIRFSYATWTYNYYEEEAIAAGFVHPYGTNASSANPYQDWVSYVVWIISRPKAERDVLLSTNSIFQTKYDIIVAYMSENHGMDMEAISTAWQSVGSTL